jgi:pilus assembly protein Flp/PilA
MTNLVFSIISFLQARFDRSDEGEVAIEYVLVGGLAAIAIIAGMAVFSTAVGSWFTALATEIGDALPG